MITRSIITKRSRKAGQAGEIAALYQLRYLGFVLIEAIETGWRVKRAGKKIIGATPLRKVSGDFKAMTPGGRTVIVEVKARPERLQYGDLERHQVDALTSYHSHGGIALLIWRHEKGIAVMRWPVFGFVAGTSISIDHATTLNLKPRFWEV